MLLYHYLQYIYKRMVFEWRKYYYVLFDKTYRNEMDSMVLRVIYDAIICIVLLSICVVSDIILRSALRMMQNCETYGLNNIVQNFNVNIVKDCVICGMGIAGVILGLYASSIISVYTTKYLNAPTNVANTYMQNYVTFIPILELMRYMLFSVFVLLLILMGYSPFIATMLFWGFYTTKIIYVFGTTGKKVTSTANLYAIAYRVDNQICRILQHLFDNNILSKDDNFCFYFRNECFQKIRTLCDIAKFSKGLPNEKNSAMVEFMKRNLELLNKYWRNKETIPYDSLWFTDRTEFKLWHDASEFEIEMALKTGTSVHGKSIKYYFAVEENLLVANEICMKRLFSDKDTVRLCSYFEVLQQVAISGIGNSGILNFWIKQLTTLKTQVINYVTGNNDDNTFASLVEYLCCLYMQVAVEIGKSLETIDINAILKCAREVNKYRCIDFGKSRYLNNVTCKNMYEKIETEQKIEGHRVTPDWIINQTVACEINNEFVGILNVLRELYLALLNMGKELQEKNQHLCAAVTYSKIFELDRKCVPIIIFLGKQLSVLQDYKHEDIELWAICCFDNFRNILQENKAQLYSNFLKCCVPCTVKSWQEYGKHPDMLGFYFYHVGDELISAIENDDFELFSTIYKKYFPITLLYDEYIRGDVSRIKAKHLQNCVNVTFATPVIIVSVISGLAIIWGAFSHNAEWEKCINAVLDNFPEESKNAIFKFLGTIAKVHRESWAGLSNRVLLQMSWDGRVATSIMQSKFYKIKSEWPLSNCLDTDVAWLNRYCRFMSDYLHLDKPEEVFFVKCLNKFLPEELKYKTRWGWDKEIGGEE